MPSRTNAALAANDDPAADTLESLTLAALRLEIDRLDDAMLELFERRMALARRVGRAKDAPNERGLKLKPEREAAVIERIVSRAEPALRPAVQALWREIVSAGLAQQGELEVVVWAGAEPARKLDAARRRFGSSARYALVRTPREALDAAAERDAVAVLALDADAPWWIELMEQRRDLWVFEALDGLRGPGDPMALAVGRIDPGCLAHGRVLRVSAGGEAEAAPGRRRGLATHHGWRLMLSEDEGVLDRDLGVIGRAPGFCLTPG